MDRQLRHRQTKGAATVAMVLPPPRHISTLLKDEKLVLMRPSIATSRLDVDVRG